MIAGFFFIAYDTDQTPHFITAVSDNYGKQVAALIAQRLRRFQWRRSRLRRERDERKRRAAEKIGEALLGS